MSIKYVKRAVLYTTFFLATSCIILSTATTLPAHAQTQPGPSLYDEKKEEINQNTVTLIAGPVKGTLSELAQDLQTVLDDPKTKGGLRVLPILGVGTRQNTMDILFLRGVDIGMIQQDILRRLQKENPALYKDIYSRVQYIAKLYTAEYHLLVSDNIKTFADLSGKKVGTYLPGSNTDSLSKIVFNEIGISIETVNSSFEEGAAKLRAGEISGLVYVAGAPVTGFNTLIKSEDKVHFMEFSKDTLPPKVFDELMKSFLPSMLTNKSYPKLVSADRPLTTLASGVILATYNWQEGTERYRRVSNFTNSFFTNFEKFLEPSRHEKWKETNLAADVPGWTRFKAAQEWLDRQKVASSAKTKTAFEEFLQTRPVNSNDASQTREQLFGEFLKWSEQRKKNLRP